MNGPTTLRWTPGPVCPAERRVGLMGPGGPFELTEEEVLGTRHEVFVRRHRHLRALFDDGTDRHCDRPYLVHAERTVTFGEARRLVATTAGALAQEHGIGRGDRVAIAAANRPEHVIVAWRSLSSAVSWSPSTAGGPVPNSNMASDSASRSF